MIDRRKLLNDTERKALIACRDGKGLPGKMQPRMAGLFYVTLGEPDEVTGVRPVTITDRGRWVIGDRI